MPELHAHCSYCGAAFPPGAAWPRRCPACGNLSFRNPLPVCVVVVPIVSNGGRPAQERTGVLVIRRAIPPKIGDLALPGGYINYGETWQEAGAREVWEETGLRIDPARLREFRVRSARDGSLIIFAVADPLPAAALPVFVPNPETSERLVLHQPAPLAFGLHTEILELFFSQAHPSIPE